jgi:hypothetical protein
MRKPLVPLVALATALLLVAPTAAGAAADGKAVHSRTHITYAGKRSDKATGVANCSDDGGGTGAYAYSGWKMPGARTTHLNVGSVPAGLSGVASALQSSFNKWHKAEPNAPKITVATDGNVTSATLNGRFDVAWGSPGGGAVAVTTTWYDSNNKVVESDIIFNQGYLWFVSSTVSGGCVESVAKYDVANVATHEVGHTYGMGHVSARFNTMYTYVYTGETLKRSLASGDKTGIINLY